jgi:catechol 2,3-dioxygenase-like lactoylglutathione lyase family enzyme
VLGHLGINVPDLAAAKAYYDELVPLLDYQPFISSETECAYTPIDGMRGAYLFVYEATEPSDYSRHQTGLQHLAFIVRTRGAVHAVHAKVTELGNPVLHTPREFPEYPPPYFATFWLDPNGLMLEAVCHHDRD